MWSECGCERFCVARTLIKFNELFTWWVGCGGIGGDVKNASCSWMARRGCLPLPVLCFSSFSPSQLVSQPVDYLVGCFIHSETPTVDTNKYTDIK